MIDYLSRVWSCFLTREFALFAFASGVAGCSGGGEAKRGRVLYLPQHGTTKSRNKRQFHYKSSSCNSVKANYRR